MLGQPCAMFTGQRSCTALHGLQAWQAAQIRIALPADTCALCSLLTRQMPQLLTNSDLQGKAHGHAEVLKCLVTKYNNITDGCQLEMSRAVRMALWEYRPSAALTGVHFDVGSPRLCFAGSDARPCEALVSRLIYCCSQRMPTVAWQRASAGLLPGEAVAVLI